MQSEVNKRGPKTIALSQLRTAGRTVVRRNYRFRLGNSLYGRFPGLLSVDRMMADGEPETDHNPVTAEKSRKYAVRRPNSTTGCTFEPRSGFQGPHDRNSFTGADSGRTERSKLRWFHGSPSEIPNRRCLACSMRTQNSSECRAATLPTPTVTRTLAIPDWPPGETSRVGVRMSEIKIAEHFRNKATNNPDRNDSAQKTGRRIQTSSIDSSLKRTEHHNLGG
jgi:hypothetical protein